MKIDVTQDRIDRGVPDDAGKCAVALAISETTGQPANVRENRILYGYGKKLKTPPHVAAFVWAFDQGIGVEPFSFELPDDL